MGTGDILVYALRIALFILCFWALLRGGKPEQTGAALLIGGYLGYPVLALAGHPVDFARPSSVHLAYAGTLFVCALALAIQSNRIWPLFFAAFSLVELTGHVSVVVLQQGRSMAYWLMTQVPIIMQAVMLAIGTAAFMRRAGAGLYAPDWRAKVS